MNAQPTSEHPPARTTIGILVFVVCCLLSSARLIHDAPNPVHVHADDIAARSDQRFAALKAQLPAGGLVGYIGESGNSGTEDYYLAQYALAPVVVEHSAKHSLVIANFPSAPPTLPDDLRVVRDFGNGLLLLANKDAK